MSTDARRQINPKRPSLGPQIDKQENMTVLFLPHFISFLIKLVFLITYGEGDCKQQPMVLKNFANNFGNCANVSGDPPLLYSRDPPQNITDIFL